MTLKLSWSSPRLRRDQSPIQGYGVVATEKIRSGETLCVFGGYVLSIEDLHLLDETDPEVVAYFRHTAIQISDELLLGVAAEEQATVAEYLNHSCAPNAGFASSVEIVAMRDIAPGEEVTLDYAMCDATGLFKMQCYCGCVNCRGWVKGDDWQRPDLQRAYEGFWPPFLATKIAAQVYLACGGGGAMKSRLGCVARPRLAPFSKEPWLGRPRRRPIDSVFCFRTGEIQRAHRA